MAVIPQVTSAGAPARGPAAGPRLPACHRLVCDILMDRRCAFSSFPKPRLLPTPLGWLGRAGSHLLALIYPQECLICGRFLERAAPYPVCDACISEPAALSAEILCARCGSAFLNESSINEQGLCRLCASGATSFVAAFSFGEYAGTLRELIHLLKYERIRPLAEPLGRMMARALPPQTVHDAIVPMPLHWRRKLIRGFNQAELLARVVARRTGLPVLAALRRRRHSPAQASLASASQRRANVRGVFVVPRSKEIAGKRLVLVDDVLTSGATVNSAAAALVEAGAARVDVLTLARADRRRALIEYRSVLESLTDGGTA